MPVNFLNDPKEIFVDRLIADNPTLPDFSAENVTIRRITNVPENTWVNAVENTNHTWVMPDPTSVPISPVANYGVHKGLFAVRKTLPITAGEVRIDVTCDDSSVMWIDRKYYTIPWTEVRDRERQSKTLTMEAGDYEFVFRAANNRGPSYIAVAIYIDDVLTHVTDTTWELFEMDGVLDIDRFYPLPETTTVEVDLKIEPSEVYGDFVEFIYNRIPVSAIFANVDSDTSTTQIDITYPTEAQDMLTGSIDNFEDIYNNWYRFSHKRGLGYPAVPSELDGWIYDAAYDVIESTTNSTSLIGLISDEKSDDYLFNTVVSSDNSDDDGICIILAATLQGEIDEKEHTLILSIISRDRDKYINVVVDNGQTGWYIIDNINNSTDGRSARWDDVYVHTYAVRSGDTITVYSKRYQDSELLGMADELRNAKLAGIVSDLTDLKPDDFLSLSYDVTVIDIATQCPIFTGPCRYGYGQVSQAKSRFWNIRRPNDTPDVTPELKQYFIDTYGFNMGDTGISVENLGADRFKVSLDNVMYLGDIEMLPE